MADSEGPAQSPASCQFCEESTEIRWLCFYCELYLCETCNDRIHSKMKKNQNHKAIALRDLNSEEAIDTRRKVNLENMTCEIHKEQKCVSFCLDCLVKLCLTCHDEHKDHHKNELLKLYEEKVCMIQKVKQDIGEKQPLVDIEETNLAKICDDKKREYKKVKYDIDKRETDIIARVLRYSKTLHDEVDKVYQPILTKIESEFLEVQKTKVQLKEKRDIVENILHSHQAQDVLDSSKTIGDIPVPQQSRDIPNARCLFTNEDYLDSKVRQIFGEVNEIPELRLVSTYKTKLKNVSNVINWNQNDKIISSYSSGKLQRVRFDNDTMTVIKEEDINVFDMAPMVNGDVVLSSGESKLKIYTKEGTIKAYTSFYPLKTWGVNVTKHNEILVGLTESESFPVTPDSIKKVVVLNQSGDMQHTYQYSRDKERLFSWPARIITCQDIICVVDLMNDSLEGRVIALDYMGHVQWVFNGEGQKLYPYDIAMTASNQIMIADDVNHAIHVVNPRGQVMVSHQVKNLGVEGPLSLCMDNESLLWVGCKTEQDNNAKIHKMKIM